MKCPYCGFQDDRVLETRVHREATTIRRRRECLKCRGRFSTQETWIEVFPMVIKKDGRREPFSRDKILNGIRIACQKRPVSLEQMQDIVDQVAKWILDGFESEVPSQSIGSFLMDQIFRLDEVAYVRFASVYRQFKDINEFLDEVNATQLRAPTSPKQLDFIDLPENPEPLELEDPLEINSPPLRQEK